MGTRERGDEIKREVMNIQRKKQKKREAMKTRRKKQKKREVNMEKEENASLFLSLRLE